MKNSQQTIGIESMNASKQEKYLFFLNNESKLTKKELTCFLLQNSPLELQMKNRWS